MFPNIIETIITKSDTKKSYLINYIDKQLTNVDFFHQIAEGEDIYFTIKADFIGFIEHFEEVEEIVEFESIKSRNINSYEVSKDESNHEKTINSRKPITPNTSDKFSLLSLLGGIFFLIVALYSIIQFGAIFYFGWPFILLFIGLVLINYLANIIFSKLKWIGQILLWLLIVGLIGLVINVIINFQNIKPDVENYIPENNPIENETEIVPIKDTTETKIDSTDFIVKNIRVWKDYDGFKYIGAFKIYNSAIIKSKNYRLNIPNVHSYNSIISEIYNAKNTQINMKLIYQMFDSIQIKKHLNENKFAEMIVTCIQDIPYTLILPEDCNPTGYNDQFIYNYLISGGVCEPNVKFGIFSPIEFLANLKGDCDTRTLLLFTILKHYNYDVVILGSELYGHSILGINLSYKGLSKTYNNQKYIVWETTAPSIRPGILSREISNMNNWEVNLK